MNNFNRHIKKQRIVKFILVITPILVSLYLFRFTLNYYFFQDDWFNFNISAINSTKELINFLKFRDDIIAYRPLEIQTQYFLIRYIFGLNAFAFRVINFSLLFISYILLIYLLRNILKNSKAALFSAALWVTSSFHFMNLGMINYHLWGTMFWLMNFLLILRFTKTKKNALYLLSVILYVISLGIWEFAISLPIIVTAYLIYARRFKVVDVLKIFLPFYLITSVYLIIRHLFVAHLPILEYETTFNLESLRALFWYILWTFNIPEEFKKQIADNLIFLRGEFLKDFWKLVLVTFSGAVLLIFLGIIYPLYKTLKNKIVVNFRLITFFFFWFGVAIFPVLLLPNHNFMMYLTLPSIAIYLFISYLTFKTNHKYLPYAIFFLWIVLSFVTVRFYRINMFPASYQKVSNDFVANIKRKYPYLPPKALVYYHLSFRPDEQALLDQNAIQALYKDQTINIFYTKESLRKFWINTSEKRPVYLYTF